MLSKTASTSRKLMKISDFAALLWTWTIPHCDDLGHMDGSPEMIKGIVVPLRNKTLDEIATALSELETSELIKMYEFEGEKYLEIVKWEDYQTFKNDRDLQQDFPLAPWNPKVSKRNPDGKIVRLSKVKGSKENLIQSKESEVTMLSNEDFFLMVEEDSEELSRFVDTLNESTGVPKEIAKREVKKFSVYWTEPNSTRTKVKWQMEKTFEVRRRLSTWLSRAGNWSKPTANKYQVGTA